MQNKLRELFIKSFYTGNDIKIMLGLTPGSLKKLTKSLKLYKEGYSSDEIIFNLMGRKVYSEEYIEDFILQKAISCIQKAVSKLLQFWCGFIFYQLFNIHYEIKLLFLF